MKDSSNLKFLITKSREIKNTLIQEKNRIYVNGTILNFSKFTNYSSYCRYINLKHNSKLVILYTNNNSFKNKFHIDLVKKSISIGILNYHNNNTNILTPNYTFMANNNLELQFDDLPKNLYDWSEEDFFYYNLKYKQ